MERRKPPLKYPLCILMVLAVLVPHESAASDGDARSVPARLKAQYPSAKVLAESERTEGKDIGKRYTYKLTDPSNAKPFRLTVDDGGALIECEKHSRDRSDIPEELAYFCILLKKSPDGHWDLKKEAEEGPSYEHRSGRKPKLLQMYGSCYEKISAEAQSDGGYAGEFFVCTDMGSAEGRFRLTRREDRWFVLFDRVERRGTEYRYLCPFLEQECALPKPPALVGVGGK